MKLKRCPNEGSKKCVCNTPPSELEKLGLYCPYDLKDSYKATEFEKEKTK